MTIDERSPYCEKAWALAEVGAAMVRADMADVWIGRDVNNLAGDVKSMEA